MPSELRAPGTPAWIQKLQDQGIQSVGTGAQKIGKAAGTLEDSLMGEQGLAAANDPLFRFYGARQRMTGTPATSREYFHGIRSGLSKNYTGPGTIEKVISEVLRGGMLPAGAAGATVGGTLGSVVPGVGSTIGALAGRGVGMASARGLANVLNPEASDRSVLSDVAEMAAGAGLGRVAAAGIGRMRAARAARKGLLPGSAKAAVEETVLPAIPDVPPTTARWAQEPSWKGAFPQIARDVEEARAMAPGLRQELRPEMPRLRRLSPGPEAPRPKQLSPGGEAPTLTDAEAAAQSAQWKAQFSGGPLKQITSQEDWIAGLPRVPKSMKVLPRKKA